MVLAGQSCTTYTIRDLREELVGQRYNVHVHVLRIVQNFFSKYSEHVLVTVLRQKICLYIKNKVKKDQGQLEP